MGLRAGALSFQSLFFWIHFYNLRLIDTVLTR